MRNSKRSSDTSAERVALLQPIGPTCEITHLDPHIFGWVYGIPMGGYDPLRSFRSYIQAIQPSESRQSRLMVSVSAATVIQTLWVLYFSHFVGATLQRNNCLTNAHRP